MKIITIKNTITAFCRGKLNKVFMKEFINLLIESSTILVRLLDLNPEPPGRSQALYPVELQAQNLIIY